MMYLVYNLATTRIVGSERHTYWKTHGAAMAHRTRMGRMGYNVDEYGVAEVEYYRQHIERQESRVNIMTGQQFTQSVNTPLCCDPSSETYWSM
jgi:hypothetical protein